MMNEKVKTTGNFALAFSFFCLALSIAYFAWEADQWRKEYPEILALTAQTADRVSPALEDISKLKDLILPIMYEVAETRKIVADALKESEKTRIAIPKILKDVEPIVRQVASTTEKLPEIMDPVLHEAGEIRKLMPGVLAAINTTTENITEVQKLIPLVLHEAAETRKVVSDALVEVKSTREVVPRMLENAEPMIRQIELTTEQLPEIIHPVLDEVRKTRKLIPDILEEVKTTNKNVEDVVVEARLLRETIPGLMDRAETIIFEAEDVGKEAGKGAVSGVVGGIITMPFKIVGNVGKGAISIFTSPETSFLTAEDINMIKYEALQLAEHGDAGDTREWKNKNSFNYGKLTLLRVYKEDSQTCREIKVDFYSRDNESDARTLRGCKQPDGSWLVTDVGK